MGLRPDERRADKPPCRGKLRAPLILRLADTSNHGANMDRRIPTAALVLLGAVLSSCQTAAPPPASHAIACDPVSGEGASGCAYSETDAQRGLHGTRPEYDVEQWCTAFGRSIGDGDDPMGLLKASCMDGELAARVRIAAMTIPPDIFDRCEKEGENPRGGSYRDFERCVISAGG